MNKKERNDDNNQPKKTTLNLTKRKNDIYFNKKSTFKLPTNLNQFATGIFPLNVTPKLIKYPAPIDKYVKYQPTNLEKNFKIQLFNEIDLGINVDLTDYEEYENLNTLPQKNIPLTEEDKILLSTYDENQIDDLYDAGKSSETWLKKTEYFGQG
jgi:hypothetical protein